MDSCRQRNLDFAKKGFQDRQYLYTIEICKVILSKYPNCIESRRMLHIALKAIFAEAKLLTKILGQCISFFYLLSAFMFRKRSRLRLIQKAVGFYPKSKVAWILFAQVALEEGQVDLLIFAYEELYLLFPKDGRIGLALGGVYLCAGDYKNALKVGQQILETDPANTDAMILVERASLGKMEISEAIV